jgi:hypothetical protein
MIFTVASFVVMVAVAITAQAQQPDDCPPSYKLVSVAAAQNQQAAKRADKPPSGNHNGLVCEANGNSGPPYVDDTP